MGVDSQRHASAALPPEKAHYPWYRRPGVPQSPTGLVRKMSPHQDSIPPTVQPLAIRYTDWAIPAPLGFWYKVKCFWEVKPY